MVERGLQLAIRKGYSLYRIGRWVGPFGECSSAGKRWKWRELTGSAIVAQVLSTDVAIAQIVTAVTTVFYAAVFAIGYYLMIKGNRETIREMREQRLSGGRPQVLVEADYGRLPMVDIVVRNVSGGSAKDITFGFSAPIEDSSGFVVSDLPYFKDGMNFLGPGAQVACVWDRLENLVTSFREKGLDKGIAVTVFYKDLAGESYQTEWRINPLIYEGNRHVHRQDSQSVEGVLAALRDLLESANGRPGELRKLEGDGNGDDRREA